MIVAAALPACGDARPPLESDGAAGSAATDAAAARVDSVRAPSVLLVSLDTTRADVLGPYGGAARTPTIDALSASGLVAERAHTCAPVTLPAHASLLTGTYPPWHGARHNGRFRIAPEVPTLAEVLSGAGYRTAGVVGAAVLDSLFGVARGFERFDDFFADARPGGDSGVPERPADEVTDRAIRLLEAEPEGPLFLFVHYYDPHAPYAPPPPHAPGAAASDRARYLGEIEFVDRQLARLLDALRSRESARPDASAPIVVLTADHGEGLGDHGEAEHGLTLYEEVLRVPLVVSWPGRISAGTRAPSAVELVDVAPTLLDLVDLPLDRLPVRHGVSHASAWTAAVPGTTAAPGTTAVPGTTAAPGTNTPPGTADDGGPDSVSGYFETEYPALGFGFASLRGIRRGDRKLIDGPRPEVYDLARDPDERRGRVGAEPGPVETRLRRALERTAAAITSSHPYAPLPPSVAERTRSRLEQLGYAVGAPSTTPSTAPPTAPGSTGPAGGAARARALRAATRMRLAPPRDPEALLGGAAPVAIDADRLAASGQHAPALARVEAQPANIRNRPFFRLLEAECLLELGRPAEALDRLEEVLALCPRDAVAHVRAARATLEAGDRDVDALLRDALRHAGSDPVVLAAIAAVRLDRAAPGDLTAAEDLLGRARDRGLRPALLAPLRARALAATGWRDAALELLDRTIAEWPFHDEARRLTAALHLDRGEGAAALEALRPLLPPIGEPGRPTIALAIRAHVCRDDLASASDLVEALDLTPDDPIADRIRRLAAARRGDPSSAGPAPEPAAVAPSDRAAPLERAIDAIELDLAADGRRDPESLATALATLDRIAEERPECARHWRVRAAVLTALGRPADAAEAARIGLTKRPADPSALRAYLDR